MDTGSEAGRAGVEIGDRVIEVNGKTATAPLEDQFAKLREGAQVRIRMATRHGQREIKLKLTSRDQQVYILQDLLLITPEQRAHREAWIHGDNETGGQP